MHGEERRGRSAGFRLRAVAHHQVALGIALIAEVHPPEIARQALLVLGRVGHLVHERRATLLPAGGAVTFVPRGRSGGFASILGGGPDGDPALERRTAPWHCSGAVLA